MNKQKITRFLQSFVAIPMLAIGTPFGGVSPLPNPTAVTVENNTVIEAPVLTPQQAEINKKHAAELDALLASYDSPLEGLGMKFVEEAEKNDIDYRLLVAISGRESTFGKNACKKATNSFLGYGSCKMNFKSADDAIERVSASLGGNHTGTAHHYEGKTTAQILRKYNSVIPNYPAEVMRIMKMISKEEIK